jgi:hypothetical protein
MTECCIITAQRVDLGLNLAQTVMAAKGFNEMDPPLCGPAFMSHNGSSSQTQP